MAATVTLGIATASTTNATSYASGSFTPAANDLLYCFIHVSGSVFVPTMADSQNLGWDYVGSAFDAVSANTVHLFVANTPALASAMTVTFSCVGGTTASGAIVNPNRVAGMIKYGGFAIRQWKPSSNNVAASTTAITFGAATLAGNPIVGAIGNSTNAATLTPPTGYTELADVGYATPTTGLESVALAAGSAGVTTVPWGSNSASAWGGIIVELDASTTGWTIIQQKLVQKTVGTGTTSTVAMRTTVTGSMMTAAGVTDLGAANSITGISVSGMPSWAKKVDINDGGGGSETAWYGYNNTSAPTPTLTVTFAASVIGSVFINEYVYYNAGVVVPITTDPFDQLKSASGGPSTAPATGNTPALTGSTDLLVAGAGTLDSANVYSPGTGFIGAQGMKNGTTLDGGFEDGVATSSAAQAAAMTISASDNWGIWIMAFQTPSTGTLHTQSLSGIFSASGNLTRTTERKLTATFEASGVLSRFVAKVMSSTFSASGSLLWHTARSIAGSFSASGSLTPSHLYTKLLSGTFSASGTLSRVTRRPFTASFSASGSLNRFLQRALSGSFSASGNLNKSSTKSFSGTYSDSGVLSRMTKKTLTGLFSASGVISRLVNKILAASYRDSGTLNRADSRALNAAFSASGNLSKRTSKSFTGTYSDSGVLVRLGKKVLAATFSASGSLNRAISRKLTGTYSDSGSLNRSTTKSFGGIYSDSGSLATDVLTIFHVALNATFSAAGTLTKRTNKTFTAQMVTAGVLVTFIAAVYTAIKGSISTGIKSAIINSGSKLSQVGTGDKLSNINTGGKNANIQTGSEDSTINGSSTRTNL